MFFAGDEAEEFGAGVGGVGDAVFVGGVEIGAVAGFEAMGFGAVFDLDGTFENHDEFFALVR